MARLACTLHVRRAGGQPLALVPFVVERAAESVPELAYETDAQGNASIGLPPGDVLLRFFPAGEDSCVVNLNVANQAGCTYEIKVEP